MNLLVSVQKLVDNHVFLFLTLTRSMIFGSLEINLDTRRQHLSNPIAIPIDYGLSPNPMATPTTLPQPHGYLGLSDE